MRLSDLQPDRYCGARVSFLDRIYSLDDFENAARRHLPRPIFGYVNGAAETNKSLRDNREAFGEWGFVPGVLIDVSRRDPSVGLFGRRYAMPFGIAPMGIAALWAYRGDLVLAAGAAEANIPFIMSGSSLIRLEDVATQSPGSWFQAYLPGDQAQIDALIERVRLAGFETLVITVDIPVAANRETNLRTGFSTPLRPGPRLAWDGISHPRWTLGTFLKTIRRHGMPHFENNYATRGAPILSPDVVRDYSDRSHFTWAHLARIRDNWKGNLVVKGILRTDDARRARDTGADAIVVSNHGGRQLDGTVSPLRVLPDIVAACPDLPILMDSGVRRGTDILKALALGARMVFVGRPFAYAASVGGQDGVKRAIALLSNEVSIDMAMVGITKLSELDRDTHLYRYP